MLVSASPPAQLASCETSACLHQRQITEKKDKYKEYLARRVRTMGGDKGYFAQVQAKTGLH